MKTKVSKKNKSARGATSVDPSILSAWRNQIFERQVTYGDMKEGTDVCEPILRRAIVDGKATNRTRTALNKFFKIEEAAA